MKEKLIMGNLAHCGIFVQDLQKAEDFYCGILGFSKEYMFHDNVIFVQKGNLVLEIICDGKDHRKENKDEIRHIALSCKDIEKVYAFLVEKGVEVEERGIVKFEDFGANGCRFFMFRGPEQERLEFQEIL
ncbi:Glyoxalase/Bleomycin resistance protein/Dioxygenase superfamily [Sphaerochaeta pleomorpha str. Grapes]|uniref:Glyoxalase/Bleomycin resistance protein/Dioxygenase superfamily n=1 Tax=Sphaerochaeta pleomorpha (strain ATCC BAA-1885 / DSM 22778 / Grapes) TaxID=158190 RepID=G8QQI0_SPHPG|nr:glyoxalase/bleomycin resistance/extradiol dioxygenase family protein [Sphaerochaeta pleomorpha]AEV30910.1 Glyoxalase/Bleomycin resistance protein/Dioxygenase superfamily [Sphaerochaeta pleomorpha str. Grapes]